ncbi:MAG: MFS transporter [Candidatus Omnitrophica bacterium]|nr:MFS transporter [Candidatus Omnitrophota bacterium]
MLRFITTHYKILLFGFLTAFFTAPGQTFLVSLFIPHLRDLLNTDQSGISAVYSAATLLSALVLPLWGNLLDKMHLRKFSLLIAGGLACGCFVLSNAHGIAAVMLGFFLIRNMGQGTLQLISSTTMARIFFASRGKALGLANLGYPVSEAFFPFVIMVIIGRHDWRMGWVCLALLVTAVYMPAVWALLRVPGSDSEIKDEMEQIENQAAHNLQHVISMKPAQIAKDYRFYLALPATLLYACFLTALFFHQVRLIDLRGWKVGLIPAAFIVYGLFRAPASFLAGPIIDKIGAKKVFPYTVIPMMLGLVVFRFSDHYMGLFFYMAFLGFGVGFSMTVISALWAELYGTKYLGSIKGVLSSFMVFSTACAPILFGIILDAGVSFRVFIPALLLICLIVSVSAWLACNDSFFGRKPVQF